MINSNRRGNGIGTKQNHRKQNNSFSESDVDLRKSNESEDSLRIWKRVENVIVLRDRG